MKSSMQCIKDQRHEFSGCRIACLRTNLRISLLSRSACRNGLFTEITAESLSGPTLDQDDEGTKGLFVDPNPRIAATLVLEPIASMSGGMPDW